MVLQPIQEDSLRKGLEVYAKEEHIIYKDPDGELVAAKETRMVKAIMEYWQREYIHPHMNRHSAIKIIYRRYGTNELNELPMESIYLLHKKPYCRKCERTFEKLTMEVCMDCEGVKCPYDGGCMC